MVHRELDNEKEIEGLRALSLLELVLLDNAKGRILKSGDILSLTGRSVSKMEGIGKLEALFMEIPKNAPKSEKGKKVVDRHECRWEWNKSLEEWNNEDGNIGIPVFDYCRGGNHELGEEKKVNKAIGENRLGNIQRELSQR